jgi:hypothetical protein
MLEPRLLNRLEAFKRGRVWHTTRQAVAAYRKSLK